METPFSSCGVQVVFRVKGDAGWHRGLFDVTGQLVVTTSMTFSPHEIISIRARPLRPGNGERSVPADRGRVDVLADLRFEAIVIGMMQGIPSTVLWDLAVKSAGPEYRNGGTVALDREERRRMGLLKDQNATELQGFAGMEAEEEAIAAG